MKVLELKVKIQITEEQAMILEKEKKAFRHCEKKIRVQLKEIVALEVNAFTSEYSGNMY